MSKSLVSGQVEYISGHLRYAHYEVEVEDEVLLKMSRNDLKKLLMEKGEIVIDDYEIDDSGDITDISIQKA